MANVTLNSVVKQYDGGVTAVNGLDLEIRDREFMVLVGPSGCGKSTTLRMIAGLESITGGTMSIGTQVVNDVPPKDRNIAMVFQNYALYPHMSVFENMAFGLRIRKVAESEIRSRVEEAARILDLEPLLQRKPKALSGDNVNGLRWGVQSFASPPSFSSTNPYLTWMPNSGFRCAWNWPNCIAGSTQRLCT